MLILVGFEEDELKNIDDEYYAVSNEYKDWTIEKLIAETPGSEKYTPIKDGKFVIMHDLPNEVISKIMRGIRDKVNGHVIFATTTPTSLKWKLKDLLEELKEEDAYFHKKK